MLSSQYNNGTSLKEHEKPLVSKPNQTNKQNEISTEQESVDLPQPEEMEYEFIQTTEQITVTFIVDKETEKEDLNIKLGLHRITAGVKNQKPIIEGSLYGRLEVPNCSWEIIKEEEGSKAVVAIILNKAFQSNWALVVSGPLGTNIDPHSNYLLHKHYETNQNYVKSIKLLIDSAKKGHFQAITKLALIYSGSTNYPVKANPKQAFHFWKIAADRGNGYSMWIVGYFYTSGIASFKNYKLAVEYFKKAIEVGFTKAYLNLGALYFEGGFLIEKDYSLSMEYLEKSANSGEPQALVNISILYLLGAGVTRNYDLAKQYINMSRRMNPLVKVPQQIIDIIGKGKENFENNYYENIEMDSLSNMDLKLTTEDESESESEIEEQKNVEKEKQAIQKKKKENKKFFWGCTLGSIALIVGLGVGIDYYKNRKKNNNNNNNNNKEK
ncbi:erad-associated e3 ubiquitin-protein ligase component-related [Anaeramoeba flamelloides]|uniref:Erad-associated e3 ubiquitin-protein ligase component-related n=1 Tax=Anaeramoeba flamelloides TaxID=1746091 RepID=A0AAV7YY45_9EUKA|nr:erad-associated e3 ubiquitin-protein ligase component-related [Anaeramoeba flamelloides]